MKKLIFKFFLLTFFTILILIIYLSIIGIETNRLNNQITKNISKINKDFKIELKKVKLVLDPINFQINAKTIGPKLKYKRKIIEIENIKTKILLKSIINNNFSLSNLEISTKSLEVKNLISFLRGINKSTELLILENFIERGYLIADIKIEFDKNGNIKDNYKIKGFVKDGKINFFRKHQFRKIDFIFDVENKITSLKDVSFNYNQLDLFFKKLIVKNLDKHFLVNGEINNKNLILKEKAIKDMLNINFLNIKKINLNSENIFSFKLDKKMKLTNFKLKSKAEINELILLNTLDLKNFFPKINEEINFRNHKLEIEYGKKGFLINGMGDIFLQNKKDKIKYFIKKKDKNLNFNSTLEINENPTLIKFINYEKNKGSKLTISIDGSKAEDDKTIIKTFSLKEKKNIIELKNIILSDENKILKIEKVSLNYLDKENQKNKFNIFYKKDKYFLKGQFLNANKLLDDLISSNNKKELNFFKDKVQMNINLDTVRLDQEFQVQNFKGNLTFFNNDTLNANLIGLFPDNKKIKFTVNTNGTEKITTLFSDRAKPFVKRYKFIKGFEEGILDFYSIKKDNVSNSVLKIDNFKVQEVPVLAKLLILASLQGIADLLTGEGIRFTDLEIKFSRKKNLTTIEEMYAIGPAISILLDGYIEAEKLVSLRGTLVPATTINRTIASIPLLGNILVGKKVGEGIFGVSFKVKGPPKDLKTTVNPIKSLTPRFITRTLEKLKKN